MKPSVKHSAITPEILSQLPSPCWLLEEQLLEQNLQILSEIKARTGINILLALKGYALWHSFDLVGAYLDGCCASGLHEATLAAEKFGKEVHTYSPAFKEEELESIAKMSHHLVFNSPAQIERFASLVKAYNPDISLGLRVNPEVSHAPTALYSPCGLYSRLGTLSTQVNDAILKNIEGVHFHALCEEDAAALEAVLRAFEEKFGETLSRLKWVNFGGGHHITKEGYDREKLVEILNNFKSHYPHLEVYIEPGEAIGWETGSLVSTVLDIIHNGIDIAILDSSAEAQMPDTIIMPYRAEVRGGAPAKKKPYTYRLAGNTCLAGDIMGDYSFDTPLQIGDRIVFEDQMHYTMVKATTFNGIPLPSIAVLKKDGTIEILRTFGYEDFRDRLG